MAISFTLYHDVRMLRNIIKAIVEKANESLFVIANTLKEAF